MFCNNCGTQNPDGASFCNKCGNKLTPPVIASTSEQPNSTNQKNQIIAVVLAFFLGGLGALKFYLREKGANWYFYLSWTLIPIILGVIDAFRLGFMSKAKFDERYNLSSTPPSKKIGTGRLILNIFVILVWLSLMLSMMLANLSGSNTNLSQVEVSSTSTPLASTPTQKPSKTPTVFLSPTITSTATITSTPTDTPTPVPPYILTQESYSLTVTQQAKNYMATVESKRATATEIASYSTVSAKELISYPDNYKGKKLKISGKVFNIIDNYSFQIFIAGTYDAAYISVNDPLSGVYEDDYLIIYGTGAGKACGTNAFGAEVCKPLIINAFFIK